MASPPAQRAKGPPDGRLDPAFQARLLEQMHEEQAAALRRRGLRNWVLVPAAVLSLIVGVALMFSDDLMVALLANVVASGIARVLWVTNRDWIRDRLGL